MNLLKSKIRFWPIITLLLLVACTTVPISGRKQVNLLPESTMIGMSLTAYSDFLKESKVLPDSNKDASMVNGVGQKIVVAVEQYLNDVKQTKRIEGFQWEFQTVDDPTVNAWCMPGGKVVFYTGILPICQNDVGVAVVMGHEIAHAVARHGNERMSQGLLIYAGGASIDILTSEKPGLARDILLQSYGIGSTLGTLAYSRNHESEADKMGLIFMAMAGYDPREAVEFWKRMGALGGEKPPELLSTHPSDETRVSELEKYMPEALKYYKP